MTNDATCGSIYHTHIYESGGSGKQTMVVVATDWANWDALPLWRHNMPPRHILFCRLVAPPLSTTARQDDAVWVILLEKDEFDWGSSFPFVFLQPSFSLNLIAVQAK